MQDSRYYAMDEEIHNPLLSTVDTTYIQDFEYLIEEDASILNEETLIAEGFTPPSPFPL